jgi:3-oxoacyl-[acyl-carrier protein] reductase
VAGEIDGGAFELDVRSTDSVRAAFEGAEAELGPIDILVTNSGGPPPVQPLEAPTEQWEAAYRELVLAPMALVERVLPGMRERGFGRVLNVGSSSVREPLPHLMLSNSHRSALLAAFKTLARQVAADGVTLNNVLPGRIATERVFSMYGGSREAAEKHAAENIPAGRLGTVEEFAAVAAFLCSAQASYVTGTALLVDGGLTQSI